LRILCGSGIVLLMKTQQALAHELTSFEGGAIEVYILSSFTGIWMHQGTINSYAPGSHRGGCSITATFAAAWFSQQKSAAARASFEASAARNY